MGKASLASLQSLVGVVAGITSIAGGVYSAVQYAGNNAGDIVAAVRSVDDDAPLAGAVVEVSTPEKALVTTLTPDKDGLATASLAEGRYVVRASAPRHESATRAVEVQRGGRAQIRFALAPQQSTADDSRRATSGASRAVDRGTGAVRRLFRNLGL